MGGVISTPSLRARLKPLVLLGLAVGLVRYGLEFVAPDYAKWFGLYYVMPVAFVVIGVQKLWGPIRWPALLGTMALMCLIVWGVMNTLAYVTGQFLEWNHGRFYNGGEGDPGSLAAAIADTVMGKIGGGVATGLLTAIAGTVWCTIWGTVVIWLPAKLASRSQGS